MDSYQLALPLCHSSVATVTHLFHQRPVFELGALPRVTKEGVIKN